MKYSIKEISDTLGKNPDEGFRMLVNSFMEPVYHHVRRLVENHADAQDITQETFVKAYRSIGNLREYKSLPSWIMRIATNEALRFMQRNREHHLPIDDAENAEMQSLAADEYFYYSDLEAVKLQKAIHTLPPKQQAAFNLRYYDDLNYDEIADILGSSPQSVKVNYNIAKQKIIDYMNRED